MSYDTLKSFGRRNSISVGLIIGTLALMCILFVQSVALSRLQQQSEQQKQILTNVQKITSQLSDNAHQRNQQINNLNRHMDCIVQFFSQPDRSQKAITNINSCELNTTVTNSPSAPSNEAVTNTRILTPNNSSAPFPSNTPTASSSHTQDDHTAPQSNPSVIKRLLNPVKNLINDL